MSLRKVDMKMLSRVMGRVLGYMLKKYWLAFIVVVLCVIGASLATLQGTLFMQSLYDDYISPLLLSETPDFSGLSAALFRVGTIYVVGILCAYAYNRIMLGRAPCGICVSSCSITWNLFRSNTLIRMRTAISCRFIRMMSIRFAS